MHRKSPNDYSLLIFRTTRPGIVTERDFQRWAKTSHARIKDWLPRDRHTPILDLGCGAGPFLYLLERLGYTSVTGVDLSPANLEVARRMSPHAHLVEGDCRAVLADNPSRFGLITAWDILEHFPKQDILPLLNLVATALREGGRAIFQTPNGESPWVGTVGYGDFTHEWFFTPGSLALLLKKVGFTSFTARECGPVAHGVKSYVRLVLWQFIKGILLLCNLVETGQRGSGIFTRVFLATAVKQV